MQSASWIVALGAVFSMTAVLLVFQYGQPRIFYAMARDGLLPQWAAKVSHEDARAVHHDDASPASFVALWSLVGDASETYDLTNIGTLFAFAIVCIGVLVLRYTDPDRPRPFRVPFVLAGVHRRRRRLRLRDEGAAAAGVGAVRLVAADRPRALLRVRLSATRRCAASAADAILAAR